MLSTFAKRGFVVVAVIACLLTVGGWAQAESWIYGGTRAGDYFENDGGKNWREVTGADQNYTFREVNRTKQYIELEDAGRAIRIRLFTNRALIEYPGSDGYRFHHAGTYKP